MPIGATPPSGCTTNATSTCPIKSTFTAQANIQDVTNPYVIPLTVESGVTVELDLIDYGEPGSTGPGPDQVGITVTNRSGGLLFASSGPNQMQPLNGGNIVVH